MIKRRGSEQKPDSWKRTLSVLGWNISIEILQTQAGVIREHLSKAREVMLNEIRTTKKSLRATIEQKGILAWRAFAVAFVASMYGLFFLDDEIVRVGIEQIMAQKLVIRMVLLLLAVIFLWKITVIYRYIRLWTGYDRRWVSVAIILLTILVPVALYSIRVTPYSLLAYAIAQVLAGVVVVILILGASRQYIVERIVARLRDETHNSNPLKGTMDVAGQQVARGELKKLLIDYEKSEQPLTVGIDGAWGDGKTRVINDVLQDSSLTKGYIQMYFEPWRYTSEESLVTAFYAEIGQAVSVLPGASRVRLDMSAFSRQIVAKLDTTGTIKSFFDLLPQHTDNNQYFKVIRELLRDNNKRLLIVIDDIERAQSAERIIRTLQLGLHIKSDIPRSTVVMAADMQELIRNAALSQTYMQKIFDASLYVLPPTANEMLDIANRYMRCREVHGISLTQNKSIDALLRNIRGMVRAVDGIVRDNEYIQGNLNQQDIYAMNMLRTVYPSVFRAIAENRWLFVPFSRENSAMSE